MPSFVDRLTSLNVILPDIMHSSRFFTGFMIGVFDSGSGGLTILSALKVSFPEADFLYLGDHARAPYGERSAEEIYEFTRQTVDWLFNKGADLVILACNTASSVALRKLQQEWLPSNHLNKRVLGILVPTVEVLTEVSWKHPEQSSINGVIGILATPATVVSGAYVREVQKRAPNVDVVQTACPTLVPFIEAGEKEKAWHDMKGYLDDVLQKMEVTGKDKCGLLLGCTHYALLADLVRDYVGNYVKVIDQGSVTSGALEMYLKREVLRENWGRGTGKIILSTTNKTAPTVSVFGNDFAESEWVCGIKLMAQKILQRKSSFPE